MKKLFTILLILVSLHISAQETPKSIPATKDTIINKVSYKLYTGARGGKYILVVSKTTGKEYKRYIKSN